MARASKQTAQNNVNRFWHSIRLLFKSTIIGILKSVHFNQSYLCTENYVEEIIRKVRLVLDEKSAITMQFWLNCCCCGVSKANVKGKSQQQNDAV